MAQISSTVKFLSNKFPGLLNKKSVENLVAQDKISYEAAMSVVSDIESTEAVVNSADMKSFDVPEGIGEAAIKNYYGEVKSAAMVNAIKEDDTFLYNEFKEVDNARAKLAAEIISKKESDFNLFLNELKETTGADVGTCDKLIGVTPSVSEVTYNA